MSSIDCISNIESDIKRQLEVLKKLLSDPSWCQTPLLQVYRMRISQIEASLKKDLSFIAMQSSQKREGRRLVHMLLYHCQGGNVSVWESVLRNIGRLCLGRPVFATLDEARSAMGHSTREGVVSVWVFEKSLQKSLGAHYTCEPGADMWVERFESGGQLYAFVSNRLHQVDVACESTVL